MAKNFNWKLTFVFQWCRQQKLRKIAFHRRWGWGASADEKTGNVPIQRARRTLFLGDVYLNFSKYPFLCRLRLRTSWRSQRGTFCQPMSCDSEQVCSFIVLEAYVSRRLRSEKLRSDVETHVFLKKNGSWSRIQQNKLEDWPNWFIGNPFNESFV